MCSDWGLGALACAYAAGSEDGDGDERQPLLIRLDADDSGSVGSADTTGTSGAAVLHWVLCNAACGGWQLLTGGATRCSECSLPPQCPNAQTARMMWRLTRFLGFEARDARH